MKNVFVIGAGANVEIGMPSGEELKKEISKQLDFQRVIEEHSSINGNLYIMSAMEKIFNKDREKILNMAESIKHGMIHSISIDNFIDAHRHEKDIAVCGKLAILASIINAENKSDLFSYRNEAKENNLFKTWYPSLFKKMSEGCDIKEFIDCLKENSFIIFNYDRCFENYMMYAIASYYGVNTRARSIVQRMNIIHPYGIAGDFNKIPLGMPYTSIELLENYKKIRTFTESSEITKKIKSSIRETINKADRIIFLGFAYHKINLDLLFKPLENETMSGSFAWCYGTGYGISEKDREQIQDTLIKIDPRITRCEISGKTCSQFFDDYWHRLSFN